MTTTNYLVLARKWRPRTFDTLVGQEHVVKALSNALSTGRLHHAWLFTGTRGVGKTTLARILAKSLNCEQGIGPNPCGVCQACSEIDQGRFVDYLEFDAASNRGVDEMTQLLEQAVYAPTVGRFKIYTIDEVHMLTGHAFNAMLKTLEEPPPHVKFILATTDPQKIPVTVLSRCLQFNLKQMAPESIVGHLQNILTWESVGYEDEGLRLLAQAAVGSMRDALSLTDQAIAYSGAHITADAVRDMLGTIDRRYLVRFLQQLLAGDAQGILDVAGELTTRGFSFSSALEDLAVLLSRIAIEQRLPGTIDQDDLDYSDVVQFSRAMHPDVLQLFYSIAIHSRAELALSPDEYTGFVMAGLRMLSLVAPQQMAVMPMSPPLTPVSVEPEKSPKQLPADTQLVKTSQDEVLISQEAVIPLQESGEEELVVTDTDLSCVSQHPVSKGYTLEQMTPEIWVDLTKSFHQTGMLGELLRHTEWVGVVNHTVTLRLLVRISDNLEAKAKLTTLLTEYFGQVIQLNIEFGSTDQTAFAQEQAQAMQHQQEAERAVEQSAFVQTLQNDFQASIVPDSIRPFSG